eukprot:2624210-Prymnesium_polylepis.1
MRTIVRRSVTVTVRRWSHSHLVYACHELDIWVICAVEKQNFLRGALPRTPPGLCPGPRWGCTPCGAYGSPE